MKKALSIAVFALFMNCLPGTEALAHPAWGLVVDSRRQIYFSDLENIWKIDAQGHLVKFRQGVSGKHTHDLALGPDGNLYGEDLSYDPATTRYTSSLWRMTPTGELSYIIGPTTDPPKGTSIWQDRAGNMYSALWKSNQEHELMILKRAPDGRLTTLLGNAETVASMRPVVLYSIGGMTFGPDGSLYLTDGPSVRKVATSGAVTTVMDHLKVERPADNPMGSGEDARLLGLAVDAEGIILAADYSNRRVLKIAPDGKSSALMTVEAPWSPVGVAVSGSDVYILEVGFTPPRTYLGPRVRKLTPDGKVSVLAMVGASQKATGDKSSTEGTAESVNGQLQGASLREQKTLNGLGIAVGGLLTLGLIVWLIKRLKPRKERHNPS